jgi:outer membrane protein assembly factor BamA
VRRLAPSLLLALLLGSAPSLCPALEASVAESVPATQALPVTAIEFAGNRTTRPRVMLRELPFTVGGKADLAAVERGRQAILDLGLFKAVQADSRIVDGGLVVTYTVVEKFYILPLPRVDANTDGQYAYGLQLRWSNLWGLNHTLRVTGLQREAQREGVGKENQYSFSYGAPFVAESRWSLGLGASYTDRPVEVSEGTYNEEFQTLQFVGTRSLSPGPPSQGWSFGTGLLWQHQDTSGLVAPYGEATAPVLSLGYRDLRFRVYSEEGLAFGSRLEVAQSGLASDYDYTRLSAGATRYWEVGGKPYQTFHLLGEVGLRWQGPAGVNSYGLGGSSVLRGYDKDFIEGDAYYRFATEFVRPVGWRWLRAVLITEVGALSEEPGQLLGSRVYSSIGLGLRLRLPTLVDFEVEAGIAMPLTGGSARVFGGKV